MPKSQVRKKKVYTPPAELRPRTAASSRKPSPVWVPALAVSLIVFGILYLVVYYLTQGFVEVSALKVLADLGYWNLAIGFSGLVASLLVLSRWH